MKPARKLSSQQIATIIALVAIAVLLLPYLGILADRGGAPRPWEGGQRLSDRNSEREVLPSRAVRESSFGEEPNGPSLRAAGDDPRRESQSTRSTGLDEIEALLAR